MHISLISNWSSLWPMERSWIVCKKSGELSTRYMCPSSPSSSSANASSSARIPPNEYPSRLNVTPGASWVRMCCRKNMQYQYTQNEWRCGVHGVRWCVFLAWSGRCLNMSSPKLRSGFEWNLVIDVLTTVTMKNAVFWDVILYRLVEVIWCFRRSSCPYHQGKWYRIPWNVSTLLPDYMMWHPRQQKPLQLS